MKPILCFCLCLLSVSGFCQVKVGVQAGYNYTTFLGKNRYSAYSYYYSVSSLPAFNAGIISSIPVFKRVSLQPSLLLSEKGAKEISQGEFSPLFHTHLRIYYAHLPVQIMYTFINKKQWYVSAGGGGFISKGIWGTSNIKYHEYGDTAGILVTSKKNKVNFTNDLYNYNSNKRNVKPWDYGYTVAAEAGWQHWQLKAAYDFGVVEIIDHQEHRTGVFSLSAGYYFTKKKKEAQKDRSKPNL